jgi:ribosomal protein S18 acetylase RimI-like enzyme
VQVKNSQLRVRPVEQRDAPQLQHHCFPLNTLEETELQISAALQAFAEGVEITLVAEVLGTVVGAITIQRQTHRLRRHRATLSGLVVHEPYQGQGIARALVEACHLHAQAMEIEILELSCRGGESAEQIYRRLGFQVYGSLPRGLIDAQVNDQVFDEIYLYQMVAENID